MNVRLDSRRAAVADDEEEMMTRDKKNQPMKPRWAAFALCAWCAAWAPWQASASGSAVSNDPRDILTVDERVGWDMNYPLEHARPERSRFLANFFRGATAQSVAAFLDSEQLLQQAARYTDSADVVAFLIESGYDPNEAFGLGIQAYPHDYGPVRREGPLHFAAKYNPNPSIVEALVQGGADVHAPAGHMLNTPLQYAARHNSGAVVAALLQAGARVEAVNGKISPMYRRRPNINGNTALHEAGANKDASVVDVLVDAGADVNGRNASGLTPLHFAAIHGRAATLVALARRGADPNASIDFAESEEQTHECQYCDAFELLVRTLADRVDGYEKHALDDADLEQARNLLQALAEAGANIDAAGGALRLAVRAELGPRLVALFIDAGVAVEPYLLEAVFAPSFQYAGSYAGGSRSRAVGSQENLRVLDLLMDEGLDVTEADSCGLTALHRVASLAYRRENSGLVRAVRKLAAVGVDVNARTVESGDYCDDFGATPLHMAADSGALDVASALIDAGANMEAKDAQGRTPSDVAAALGHLDLAELLRKTRFASLGAADVDLEAKGAQGRMPPDDVPSQ